MRAPARAAMAARAPAHGAGHRSVGALGHRGRQEARGERAREAAEACGEAEEVALLSSSYYAVRDLALNDTPFWCFQRPTIHAHSNNYPTNVTSCSSLPGPDKQYSSFRLLREEVTHLLHPRRVDLLEVSHAPALPSLLPLLLLLLLAPLLSAVLIVFIQRPLPAVV